MCVFLGAAAARRVFSIAESRFRFAGAWAIQTSDQAIPHARHFPQPVCPCIGAGARGPRSHGPPAPKVLASVRAPAGLYGRV